MASKTSPPKPWEVRRAAPANSTVPVSSTVARSALEPADSSNSGLPIDRIDPNSRSPHIGGNGAVAPRLPPRPGLGSSMGGYGSTYGGSAGGYGGYGNSYSNLNRYGSGYGSSYSGYSGGYGGYGGSGYGSSYGGSGYGSSYAGSGYGSSYGGYGSSYGGSGYGGYGGGLGSTYGRYGLGYREGMPREGGAFQNVLDGGYNQMNRFGQLVESFSRFSRLLDANFDALHGSFASVIRLMDVFGEFFYVVQTFAVFKLIFGGFGKGWEMLNAALGRDVKKLTGGKEGIQVEDYTKFQANQKRKGLPMMFIMMGVILASVPLLLIKLWRAANKMKLLEGVEQPQKMEDAWPGQKSNGISVRATHSFEGETEMDLPFREGAVIRLLGKPFPEWWEGEINGRKGLFPSNFVEEIIEEIPRKEV